jgi:Zn-dependent alcohol dehydrogenase
MIELNKKLAIIQTKLKAKKSSYNSFGKYYFRKAEDILEAAKPFLIENSVSITITEEVIPGHTVPIVQSTAIISDGENSIQATAVVGVDLNQKGMQTAQQFGAASTYGKKYALGNLFLIDDTEDADATNTHGRASQIVNKAKAEMTADQLKKAIEFVKGGGAISSIETKYNVTEKQMKTLQNG